MKMISWEKVRMDIFKDKVTIITGAGSGIGCALAQLIAHSGGIVVVTNRTGESALSVAENIRRSGGKAEAATLDVVDAGAVQHVVDETVRKHGRLDYMFNNAGIGLVAEAKDHTLEDWNTTLDINLRGVIHGVHAAYPIMRHQGFGHIVNTASLDGLVPMVNETAYVASKFAVVGLTMSMRAEAATFGVKTSVICPGFVDTPMLFEKAINKYVDKMGFTSRDDVKRSMGGIEAMGIIRDTSRICY